MLELLEFTFRSGWHFAGCFLMLLLLCLTVGGVASKFADAAGKFADAVRYRRQR